MARGPKQPDERPIPAHPYRDTALVYGCLALVLIIVAGVTGGNLVRAVIAATGFWIVATAWTCWRFSIRIKARDARKADEEPAEAPVPAAPDRSVNGNGRGRTKE